MSEVIIHRHAAKYHKHLPRETKDRVKEVLKELEERPLGHPGVKRMFGEWAGYHRIRVGKLRIIFWFDEKDDIVYVDYIGPRGDVYK